MAAVLGDRAELTSVPEEADRIISTTSDRPNAVTALHSSAAAVWGADLMGLGLSLAALMERPGLVAVTENGDAESGGELVRFPDPLGVVECAPHHSPIPHVRLLVGTTPLPWAGVRVVGERTVAMVDDLPFAQAVSLAAAAELEAGPVWDHARSYVSRARELGLRFAQPVV